MNEVASTVPQMAHIDFKWPILTECFPKLIRFFVCFVYFIGNNKSSSTSFKYRGMLQTQFTKGKLMAEGILLLIKVKRNFPEV